MTKKVNHIELKTCIKHYYNTITPLGKPSLFVWGRFGIGKSFAIRDTAEEIALSKDREFIEWNKTTPEEKQDIMSNPKKYFVFIDIRLSEYDSSDIKGLPIFEDNKKSIQFKIPSWALLLEHEDSDGVLLFDEINLAVPLVMSSAYKIIYDKVVNDGKINKNWLIIGAGNTAEDRSYTHDVSPPLLDRGGEVELVMPTADEWTNWAIENGINKDIIGFINFKNSNLYKVDFDDNQKFTTGRGWERVSALMKTIKDKDFKTLELIGGTAISEGVSKEFVAYCKISEQINLEDLIKNPKKLKDITEISIKYFLITSIADKYKESKVNFDKIQEVSLILDELKNAEFVALLWRMCNAYNKEQFRNDFSTKIDKGLADKYAKYII